MRRAIGTALLAVAICLTAGCGGASHGPGVATAAGGKGGTTARPSASADSEEQRRQFTQCMRDHGAQVSDADPDTGGSGTGGGGVRITASGGPGAEDAIKQCEKYLPAGKLAAPDPQQLEQMRQFAQCMREHGVDMADPDPNGGGIRIEKGTGAGKISPDDPAFQAAQEACKDKLPGKLRGGSNGGSDTAPGGKK
jgi:hypothetical protein